MQAPAQSTRTTAGVTAASRAALLAALHPQPDALARHVAADAPVDWSWVLAQATAHKVAALVAARLLETGIAATLDPALQAQLAAAQEAARTRAAEAEHTLAALAAGFGADGVPFFVVKGSVLVREVYGAPDRRRFADVDIVVREADVDRAETVLRRLGYRIGGVGELFPRERLDAPTQAYAERLARRFSRRHLGAYSWYPPSRQPLVPVDLHWLVNPGRLPREEAALWAHLRPLALDGATVQTFTPAAALLHLAAHATAHLVAGFRLLHLTDVAWAAQRYADALPAARALAAQWGMAAHFARVFELVDDLFGSAPPHASATRRRPVVDPALLFAAPSYRDAPWQKRLVAEVRWGLALGGLPDNVRTVTAAALARARLAWFRRRRSAAR